MEKINSCSKAPTSFSGILMELPPKGPHHSHGRCFVFVFVRPARLPMQSHRPDVLWNPPRYNMLVYKAPWLFDYR